MIGGLVQVEFGKPEWLLLAPAAWLLCWWAARGGLAAGEGLRRSVLLAIRCVVLTALAAALAEPRLARTARDVAVVVVQDVSDSIPADQRRLGEAFIGASAQLKSNEDYFGLVTTATRPLAQVLPTQGRPSFDVGSFGATDATNLQGAVELARALLPAEAGGRVVLISDFNQTMGSLLSAARACAAAKLPLDVAVAGYDRTGAIRVKDVIVPPWAREGDVIAAKVQVEAGRPGHGRLAIMLNGEVVDLDPDSEALSLPVEVTAGLNLFTASLKLPSAPVHTIEAVLELDEGTRQRGLDVPELLRGTGVVFTNARGRVLLVTEKPEEHEPLRAALASDDVRVEVRSAGAMGSLTELAVFDAVILANQSASDFSYASQEELVRYVHDVGGGLVVVGGPESFGAGGWIGSPLAAALPVLLDPPQKRQLPMGALALIIDQSGSMGAPVAGTTLDQQQIANQAAVLGVRALSRLDQVTVIAFSDNPRVVVPLVECDNVDEIARRIRQIAPAGGTDLFPAFDAAAAELNKSRAGVKHIIVLTDGQTVGEPNAGLARAARLRQMGITMSTVAIGDAMNGDLLKRLAFVGGGRYHPVTSSNSLAVLPQIFIKESQVVRRALIWEGPPFRPRVEGTAESMRGLGTEMPVLTGYIVTAERGGLASVLLRGMENDPVLAQWQHGLGRVVAFTSDATTKWNAAWTGWPAFEAFWKQQLAWAMRPEGDPSARISSQTLGDRTRFTVHLVDDAGDPVNFARFRSRIAHPDGSAEDVPVTQVGPGRYEAEARTEATGVHFATFSYIGAADVSTGQPRTRLLRASVVRQAGSELRHATPDEGLMRSVVEATGGRIYRLDQSGASLWSRDGLEMPKMRRAIWLPVALLALSLFLVDVAARRLAISPAGMRRWATGVLVPGRRAPAGGSIAALSTAKARAMADITSRVNEESRAKPDVKFEAPASRASAPAELKLEAPPSTVEMPEGASEPASDQPGDTLSRLRAARRRGDQ